MLVPISCRIDTSNLLKAQAIMQKYSRQTPAESLNRTALFVLREVQKITPFVSPATIETELRVTTASVEMSTGKLAARKDRANRSRTLAEKIVLARMWSASNYSVRTGNYWPIDRPAGRGSGPTSNKHFKLSTGGRAAFNQFLADRAQRMISARKSSSKFFVASWGVLIRKILPFVPTNYRGGAASPPKAALDDMGEVTPAAAGGLTATCTVENKLGTVGRNSVLYTKHNEAFIRICAPILQGVVDREAEQKFALIAAKGWDQYKPGLAACGVTVSD
jgi:hypothetical protein